MNYDQVHRYTHIIRMHNIHIYSGQMVSQDSGNTSEFNQEGYLLYLFDFLCNKIKINYNNESVNRGRTSVVLQQSTNILYVYPVFYKLLYHSHSLLF